MLAGFFPINIMNDSKILVTKHNNTVLASVVIIKAQICLNPDQKGSPSLYLIPLQHALNKELQNNFVSCQ